MKRIVTVMLAVLLLVVMSCERRRDPTESARPFTNPPDDAVLVVVLDLSGSFSDKMFAGDGKAFAFMTHLLRNFFQESIGVRNRVIITQISGAERPVVFEGSIGDFKAAFSDKDAFKRYVMNRSQPGSRVFDSLSDGIEYALWCPTVAKGKTRIGFFALTDMENNIGTPESLPRLLKNVRNLAEYRAVVGLYWVRQDLAQEWSGRLAQCGLPLERFLVTADAAANPPLPKLLQ